MRRYIHKILISFLVIVVVGLVMGMDTQTTYALPPIRQMTSYFPLGVFEDRGMIPDTATFDAMLRDIKSRGMDSVLFTNGSSGSPDIYSTSDNLGINII